MDISDKYFNLERLYQIALAEKEGLGTAYEYFIKINLLNKLLNGKKLKKILVYGLPERYGFGFDSLVLAYIHGASLVIVDERQDVLDRARAASLAIKERGILTGLCLPKRNAGYRNKRGICLYI